MRVLLACAPKSGSTFIVNALGAALQVPVVRLTPGYGRREQELSERVIQEAGESFVAQHHVRFSEITGDLLERYGIAPVVLMRNLSDTVVSIRDHFEHEGVGGPLVYLDESFNTLPEDVRTSAIVDLMAPWYFSFARSWADCPTATAITYEGFFSEPAWALASLCSKLGVDLSPERASAAIDTALKGFNRFNVGATGRGRTLGPQLCARMRRMASYFPDHDFGALGFGHGQEPTGRAN